MIEHIRAVESLHEILAVAGLDAIFIGPYDLSASMGITGRFEDPRFTSTIEQIRLVARERSIPCGLHIVEPDPAALQARIAEGYQFIAYSIDAVLLARAAQQHNLQ
jgi:2-dehydro-3-deoxyglucarate aldolase